MEHELNKLSCELRSRIKKEILDPLAVMEQISHANHTSLDLIDKVFKDFKKSNDKIWNEFMQKIKG